MSSAVASFGLARVPGRLRFLTLVLGYAALVALCLGTFVAQGELSSGRNPWANLVKSVGEFSRPSFFDLWFGERRVEYRSDDGTLLRVEDRHATEARFVGALGEATWTTFRIATLGSLLGALLALPFGLLSARNLHAPRPLAWAAKGVLDVTRAIHTLVFGLVLVGIVGLGPTAGILAIGLHSMGTYGKLFAESKHQPATELTRVSADSFVAESVGARFDFERNAEGKVIAVTMDQAEAVFRAEKR